ncbi:hypothetical protein [Azospirillum sp. B4]|uniref:hypothetical protein n=1 Tax=Azospirillum sp. B4 TaxID=95605 RepID=UPI0005C990B0|nr:hypothetical protein [Azospirillum sp. B4]
MQVRTTTWLSIILFIALACATAPAKADYILASCDAPSAAGRPREIVLEEGPVAWSDVQQVSYVGGSMQAGYTINGKVVRLADGSLTFNGSIVCTAMQGYQVESAAGVSPSIPQVRGVIRYNLQWPSLSPDGWQITDSGVTLRLVLVRGSAPR